MPDPVFSHAIRVCLQCQTKLGGQQGVQLALLSSPTPIKVVCGKYVKLDLGTHKPCPSCQLRFRMNFKGDECANCQKLMHDEL